MSYVYIPQDGLAKNIATILVENTAKEISDKISQIESEIPKRGGVKQIPNVRGEMVYAIPLTKEELQWLKKLYEEII